MSDSDEIVKDEDLKHDAGCATEHGNPCSCGAYQEQQMVRLRRFLGLQGVIR